MKISLQILGDITSNLDAKKACTEALKIQKKYLSKASSILCLPWQCLEKSALKATIILLFCFQPRGVNVGSFSMQAKK